MFSNYTPPFILSDAVFGWGIVLVLLAITLGIVAHNIINARAKRRAARALTLAIQSGHPAGRALRTNVTSLDRERAARR
jgi:hypothetical protein